MPLPISAATRQGLDDLPGIVFDHLKELPPIQIFQPEYVKKQAQEGSRSFTVSKTEAHTFSVDAPWLERILAGTNVEDYESLQYFQTQLGDSGILDELVKRGVQENDTIRIGDFEFDYVF